MMLSSLTHTNIGFRKENSISKQWRQCSYFDYHIHYKLVDLISWMFTLMVHIYKMIITLIPDMMLFDFDVCSWIHIKSTESNLYNMVLFQ